MRCSKKTTFPLHYFRLVPNLMPYHRPDPAQKMPSFVKTFEKASEFLILITSHCRRIKANLLTTNRTLLQTIKYFPSRLRGENWKRFNYRTFWISVWIKLGQTNVTIIATKLRFQNSVPTKTQNRRFQIPSVWRKFLKSSVFATNLCERDKIKLHFQIPPG